MKQTSAYKKLAEYHKDKTLAELQALTVLEIVACPTLSKDESTYIDRFGPSVLRVLIRTFKVAQFESEKAAMVDKFLLSGSNLTQAEAEEAVMKVFDRRYPDGSPR